MRRLLYVVASLPLLGLLWLNGQAVAVGGIHAYQRTAAPLLTIAGAKCRFTPTCSRYAEIVITRDGLLSGGWKTAKRIVRCGPWTDAGTVDDP